VAGAGGLGEEGEVTVDEPPTTYRDFLGDADDLLARVKAFRAVAGAAAAGNRAAQAVLARMAPDLEKLLGEVEAVLKGRN
jgi:hypothetical protein